jgi:hypothetical protein
MSIHAVAEDRQATPDVQVIAELAAGALESIARIHAAGLAEVVDIAENPVVVHPEPTADAPAPVEAGTGTDVQVVEGPVEAAVEGPAGIVAEAATEAPAAVEPATDQFAAPAEIDVVQPVESLRAVPVSTRGRHFSEAETTEFAAQRAA